MQKKGQISSALFLRRLSDLRRSDFFKSAAILASGTTVSQIISIAATPFVLRLYHPGDYGIFALYFTLCTIISSLSTLQLHNALIVSKDDNEVDEILKLINVLALLISALCFLILFLFKDLFLRLCGNEEIGRWIYLIPLSVYMIGINNAYSSMFIREKKFKLLIHSRVATSLVVPAISICLGIFYAGPSGLIISFIIGQITGNAFILLRFNRIRPFMFSRLRRGTELLKTHKNFLIYSLPSDFLNMFSNQLPVLMLTKTSSSAVVGYFGLSYRMLALPIQLVSTSVSEVFRQRASIDYNTSGSCRPIFLNVFKLLVLLSIIPFITLLLFGPDIFAFVFGSQWKEAGVIARILSILFVFKFVVSPLSYVTYIAGKQWAGLLIDGILLFTIVSIYFIAFYFRLDYKISLLIYSLSYSSLYFLTFYISYKFTINTHNVRKHQADLI